MTLALHGKSKRRQVGLMTSALVAVLLATVAAVLWLGTARATQVGFTQQEQLPISFNNPSFLDSSANCDAGPYTSGYVWHFVLSGNTDTFTSLTGTFTTAGSVAASIGGGAGGTDAKHAYIRTATADTLTGVLAVTTPDANAQFQLSHTCHLGVDPTVTVNKTNSTADNLVAASGTFDWIITATVANGPTIAPYIFNDAAPTGMTFGTNAVSVANGGTAGKLTCAPGTGTPIICTLASGAATGDYILTIHVTAPSSTAGASVCMGYTNTVMSAAGAPLATNTVNVTGCPNTATLTVKKVVSGNASSVTDPFGGTVNSQVSGVVKSFTDLSQNTPKAYSDLAPGTYFATETNANGYTPLGYSTGNADGNCVGATSTTASAVTVTLAAGDSKVLCIYNEKTALVLQGSVVVKKDYVLNGGTKVVPVVHVEDLFDPTPNIDAGGVNDATHSQWEPVPVDTSGIVTVWEDLPAGWTTNGPPTVSGSCEVAQLSFLTAGELLQSSEQLAADVSDPNAIVELTVRTDGTCIVTFHNVRIETSRKIRIGKVTATATHPAEAFTGTIAPGAPTTFSASLPANAGTGPIGEYVMSSQVAQVVTETNIPANWTLDGYFVTSDTDGVKTCSPTASYTGTSASVPAGSGTYLVCIKNTYTPPIVPPGAITVTKTTTLNGSPQPQERIGWHIQVTSVACSVNLTQDTDAAGKATFSNLPVCNDYVVSEDTVNAPFAGYTAVTASMVTAVAVTSNGNTPVGFTNNRVFNPPPICQFGCSPVIISTPTAPPPTPTIVPPTPTVAPPTPTPTKAVDVVAGEKTPGAIATPLAPSTGSGFFGGDGSSANLFLAMLGMAALTVGLAMLGFARKAR